MLYIKKASAKNASSESKIKLDVQNMLEHITHYGEEAVQEYALKFDDWRGDFILSDQQRAQLIDQVPAQTKQDIQFSYQQVTEFARAQLASLTEFQMTTDAGAVLGQKIIPLKCAGCYVPGGRYSHAASAIMSIATAKVAGVEKIIACSPPKNGSIHPAIVYAMDLAGADIILQMGGVPAIASMAKGLFTGLKADILVGPGNGYVAHAKRLLFGEVGIDVFAGPTESAIIADHTADPMTIAVDLVSQAEHGIDSPVWLFTTDKTLAEKVAELMPKVAADMPNPETVIAAWADHGEIIYCESAEQLLEISDQYASEHLQVITEDPRWWLDRLKNYGSLFLGEGATVTHGDKCSGTNHILPTRQVARYSGGLNVHKFLKILTYQEINQQANLTYSAVGSRISRAEGMEGHARACDWRLRKYFPDTQWDFAVYRQKRYD